MADKRSVIRENKLELLQEISNILEIMQNTLTDMEKESEHGEISFFEVHTAVLLRSAKVLSTYVGAIHLISK